MKTSDIISDLEKVFNKYSFEELTKSYDDILSTYVSVRYSKYFEETNHNSNFGSNFLENLYDTDPDFKDLIEGINNCALYQIKVMEFEEKEHINIGSWEDIFQCAPICKIGVLDKFRDITQEKKLATVFSDWWIDKFANTGYFKDKNIYKIYLEESENNKTEYNVFVNYNKDK